MTDDSVVHHVIDMDETKQTTLGKLKKYRKSEEAEKLDFYIVCQVEKLVDMNEKQDFFPFLAIKFKKENLTN